jgi:hypothetical protein
MHTLPPPPSWRPRGAAHRLWCHAPAWEGRLGDPQDPARARRVLRRTVGLGINFVHTAWFYGPFRRQPADRRGAQPYPPDLVIATELGGNRSPASADRARLASRSPVMLPLRARARSSILQNWDAPASFLVRLGVHHRQAGIRAAALGGAQLSLRVSTKMERMAIPRGSATFRYK